MISRFYSLLKNKFPFTPTYNQDIFFQKIAILTDNQNDIFVLKGYAGKTTVISTIVNNLVEIDKNMF
jgi:hypothetical protein